MFDWTGTAFVTCPGLMPGAGDDPFDGSVCSVSTVGGDGAAHTTTFANVQGAQLLADGRVLVWSFDGSLTIRQQGSATVTIASVALDPWLDPTRNRIAFVAPADGATSLEPGDDRRVVIYDIPSDTMIEVVNDATASSPIIIPGTDQVLYVSSTVGTTAVWRVTAPTVASDDNQIPDTCSGGRAGDPMDPENPCNQQTDTTAFIQLTNLTPDIPQTLDPVFGRQRVFVGEGDALRLVYAAPIAQDDGSLASEIFAIDPSTGTTTDLGPGAFPQHGPQGSVFARTGAAGSCVAVQYLAPGAQP